MMISPCSAHARNYAPSPTISGCGGCDTAQTTYPHIDPPHDSCPQCHQPTNGRSRCGIGQAPDEPMIPLSTKAVAKYRKDNPQ